ncbi:hypothetical protein LZ30DRAFT_742284 [Colletotrichum cereale]|nr:hypothetical protein LZ30DRAFT_742284 [Colletotrichum cereale]
MESTPLKTTKISHYVIDDSDKAPEHLSTCTVDDLLNYFDKSYWEDADHAPVPSTPEQPDSSEPDSLLNAIHLNSDEVIDLTMSSDEDEHRSHIAVKRKDGQLSPKNKGPLSAVSRPSRRISGQPSLRRRRKVGKRKTQTIPELELQDTAISIKVERVEHGGKSYTWEHPRRRRRESEEDIGRYWVEGRLNEKQKGVFFYDLLNSITIYVRANSEWSTRLQWDQTLGLFRGEVCESRWLNVERLVMMSMLNDTKEEHCGFTNVAETKD